MIMLCLRPLFTGSQSLPCYLRLSCLLSCIIHGVAVGGGCPLTLVAFVHQLSPLAGSTSIASSVTPYNDDRLLIHSSLSLPMSFMGGIGYFGI